MKQQWHSGFDDSSGWGRLIDPVCLFILCQIAGTLWVIIPRKSFPAPVAPNATVASFEVEAAGLANQRSALEKAVGLAREEARTLALPPTAAVGDRDRMAAQVRLEEQRIKEQETRLAELRQNETDLVAKLSSVPTPDSRLGQEANQLGQQLATKQAEVKRLQIVLEQTKGLGEGSGVGSPRMVETDLVPMRIHMIGNRAVPIDGAHYKIERGRLRTTNEEVLRYTKTAPGESAEDIQKPQSDVGAFVRKIDRSKQYLLCLVTSDSLPVFREVRKLARKQGIEVAWDTNYDSDGVLIFILGKGKGHNRIPR